MKKNIWIINHYAFPYGYGLHIRQHTIAKMLLNLGYKVTIFASSSNHLKTKNIKMNGITKEEHHDEIKYIWIRTLDHENNGLGRIKNIFEFSRNLNKIYKKFNDIPDIIWASSPQPFVICNALKMKNYFNCKFIYEERDIWPLTLQILNNVSKYNPLSLIFRFLQIQAYKKSDIIVTPLNNLKEYIEKSGVKGKQVKYIPQPFVEFKTEQFDIDIPKDKFIVGYVGSIGHSNSIWNLIKAANLLKDDSDLFFMVVGDGPQSQEIKQYIQASNLNNLLMTGKLEKEKAMYVISKCDLLYKGNPDIELYKYGVASIKIVEYMWSNKPIIHATNIKNDLVNLSNSGLSIIPDNENKLKDAIMEMKNNTALYDTLSGNGKPYVLNNFPESTLKEKIKRIIESIEGEKNDKNT